MESNGNRDRLRQVAILVDSMDRSTADQLLDHLPESQQRQIRDAVLSLSDVTSAETDDVSQVFYGRLTEQSRAPGGFHLDPIDPALEVVPDIGLEGTFEDVPERSCKQILSEEDDPSASKTASPLLAPLADVVRTAPIDVLFAVVCKEQPQAIALVASALTADRAACFVARLPAKQQSDILRRIADFDDADPSVLTEMRLELSNQLTDELSATSVRAKGGVERLRSIVAAADDDVRAELLRGLAQNDEQLAASLEETQETVAAEPISLDHHALAVAFDRLADLDSQRLTRVISLVGIQVAALAMTGASQTCLRDVLELLPDDLKAALRNAMQSIGPLRLSDIHQAQLLVVEQGRRELENSNDKEHGRLKLSA